MERIEPNCFTADERRELQTILHDAEISTEVELVREEYLAEHNAIHSKEWARLRKGLRVRLERIKRMRQLLKERA